MCLFLINDFSWAADLPSLSKSTLAIQSQLTEDAFKEKFLAREFALSAEGADRYISEQISREKDILKQAKLDWNNERARPIDVRGYVSENGNIINNVSGLDTIKLIKVTGLFPKTGQFAKVDLTGRYDPLPVMIVDSSFYNWFDNALQKHEIEEIIQWEDLRVNILGMSDPADIDAWQSENIEALSADAREKLTGTIYESCNSTRDIALVIHSRAHPIDELYNFKAKQLGEIGVCAAFDFERLSALFDFYCSDKSGKLNIAASVRNAVRSSRTKSFEPSVKGKRRMGVSKQVLFQEFKLQVGRLGPETISRLQSTTDMGKRRIILIESGIDHVNEIDGKFLNKAIEDLIKSLPVSSETTKSARPTNRLRFAGKGRYLKAYAGQEFDYLVKIPVADSSYEAVSEVWIGSGYKVAQERLKDYSVPTLVIDAIKGDKKELLYHLKGSDSKRADLAIVQLKLERLMDRVKSLERAGRIEEIKPFIEMYKKCVIGMFRLGVVDSDFGGSLYNYGIDEKTGKVFIFDLGDICEGPDMEDEFFNRLYDMNKYIENDLREISPRIADYYRDEGRFVLEDFYDDKGKSLFGVDYDKKDPEKFKMSFPISEEDVYRLFANNSVRQDRPAGWGPGTPHITQPPDDETTEISKPGLAKGLAEETWDVNADRFSGTPKGDLKLVYGKKHTDRISLWMESEVIVVNTCDEFNVVQDKRRKGYGARLLRRGLTRAMEEARKTGMSPQWAWFFYHGTRPNSPRVKAMGDFLKKFGFKEAGKSDLDANPALTKITNKYSTIDETGLYGGWYARIDDIEKVPGTTIKSARHLPALGMILAAILPFMFPGCRTMPPAEKSYQEPAKDDIELTAKPEIRPEDKLVLFEAHGIRPQDERVDDETQAMLHPEEASTARIEEYLSKSGLLRAIEGEFPAFEWQIEDSIVKRLKEYPQAGKFILTGGLVEVCVFDIFCSLLTHADRGPEGLEFHIPIDATDKAHLTGKGHADWSISTGGADRHYINALEDSGLSYRVFYDGHTVDFGSGKSVSGDPAVKFYLWSSSEKMFRFLEKPCETSWLRTALGIAFGAPLLGTARTKHVSRKIPVNNMRDIKEGQVIEIRRFGGREARVMFVHRLDRKRRVAELHSVVYYLKGLGTSWTYFRDDENMTPYDDVSILSQRHEKIASALRRVWQDGILFDNGYPELRAIIRNSSVLNPERVAYKNPAHPGKTKYMEIRDALIFWANGKCALKDGVLYIRDATYGSTGASMPKTAVVLFVVAAVGTLAYYFSPIVLSWMMHSIIENALSLPSAWQKATGILAIVIATAYFICKPKPGLDKPGSSSAKALSSLASEDKSAKPGLAAVTVGAAGIAIAAVSMLMRSHSAPIYFAVVGIYFLIVYAYLFHVKTRLADRTPVTFAEKLADSFTAWRAWGSGNISRFEPTDRIKIWIALGAGFTTMYVTTGSLAWPSLWFLLTVIRNYSADQAAARKYFSDISFKFIRAAKLSNAVFFSGLALPVMYCVKGLSEYFNVGLGMGTGLSTIVPPWLAGCGFSGIVLFEIFFVGTIGGIDQYLQRRLRGYSRRSSFWEAVFTAYPATVLASLIFGATATGPIARSMFLLTRKVFLEMMFWEVDYRHQAKIYRKKVSKKGQGSGHLPVLLQPVLVLDEAATKSMEEKLEAGSVSFGATSLTTDTEPGSRGNGPIDEVPGTTQESARHLSGEDPFMPPVASALNIFDVKARANFKSGQHYVIRYDEKRLAASGNGKTSALEVFNYYVAALRFAAGEDWDKKVKIKKRDSDRGKDDYLICVERYAGADESAPPVGRSAVDVKGNLGEQELDVVRMLNMAIAACEAPLGAHVSRLKEFGFYSIVDMQYEALTGRPLEKDIDKMDRGLELIVLELPPARKRDTNELPEYYRLTISALRKYA